MPHSFFSSAVLAAAILASTPLFAQTPDLGQDINPKSKLMLIGTAGPKGVYFPAGNAVCDVINEDILVSGIRCLALNTGGAVYNIHAVHNDHVQIGVTRDDLLADAYIGREDFQGTEPMSELRIIMPLYDDPVSIIVREESPINTVEDLKGKHVNIGALGTGRRAFSQFLFKLKRWSEADLASIGEYSIATMLQALCENKFDAMIQLVGYPSHFYDNLQRNCPVRALSLDAPTVQAILKEKPSFKRIVVKYPGNDGQMRSFNTVAATIVLFADTNSMTAEEVRKILQQLRSNTEYLHNNSSITHSVPAPGASSNRAVPYFQLF
ncbi:MAG: TAXI family TRAP transporter solute-binding subunit [bacterium]